ncbi:hypothetical protein AB4189_26170, partial [Vibrio sp. 10N.286.49.E1]
IEEKKFWRQQSGRLTASFGLSELRTEDLVSCMIKRADEALYCAKEHGRNTVYHSENGQDLPSELHLTQAKVMLENKTSTSTI